ncbi:MAG: GNAT family N-acetyltransferase [Cyanobacteria bacterium P01_H01_bin.15]
MCGATVHFYALGELPPDAIAIRRTVFQTEQGVSAALEFDGEDSNCVHGLALIVDRPVATTRLRWLTPQTAKIERVAVLAEFRRRGIARQLMNSAIAYLETQGCAEIQVHAQAYVAGLYTSLGFLQQSDLFEEAGIAHVKMSKVLIS